MACYASPYLNFNKQFILIISCNFLTLPSFMSIARHCTGKRANQLSGFTLPFPRLLSSQKNQLEHSQPPCSKSQQSRSYFKVCPSQNNCHKPRELCNLVAASPAASEIVPVRPLKHTLQSFSEVQQVCSADIVSLIIICNLFIRGPHLTQNLRVVSSSEYRALQRKGQENPPHKLVDLLMKELLVISFVKLMYFF